MPIPAHSSIQVPANREFNYLMRNDGLLLGDVLYASIRSCKDLPRGMKLHSQLVSHGIEPVSSFAENLIRLFSSFGKRQEANQVFCKVVNPCISSWTSIILANVELGSSVSAWVLYNVLRQRKIHPSKHIYLSMLKLCINSDWVLPGKIIHDDIIRTGLENDSVIDSILINLYVKHGNIQEARKVFDKSSKQDAVLWSSMITGYTKHGQGADALEVFNLMLEAGLTPDAVTYSCVFKACGSIKAIEKGRSVHDGAIKCGSESDVAVGNTIINMYAICGSLIEAQHVFDQLPDQNTMSWGAIIAACVRNGNNTQACVLFKKMQTGGIYPDKVTTIFALKACNSTRDIQNGHEIHHMVIASGFDRDVMVGSVLIEMYGACGKLEDAYIVFQILPTSNVYSWNAIMSGYASSGLEHNAVKLWDEMQQTDIEPDKATFSCILKSCANLCDMQKGMQVHDLVVRSGFHADIILENAVLDMYAKCGEMDAAKKLFDKLLNKDTDTWDIMISGYVQHGHHVHALDLFQRFENEGFKSDTRIVISVLKACGSGACVHLGKTVHDHVIRSGYEKDVIVGNAVVDMYSKCGYLPEALQSFQLLATKTLISWNTIINGHVYNGENESAMDLFGQMQQEGLIPDRVTISNILKACSKTGSISHGKQIHEDLLKYRLQSSIVVGSTLINMYSKCGRLDEAREVFDQMPDRCLVSWGAMISGYAVQGDGNEALSLYWKMISEGNQADKVTVLCLLKACSHMGALEHGNLLHMQVVHDTLDRDVAIGSILVHMYAKTGCFEDAENVLTRIPEKNIVSWNSIVGGYVQQGDWRQAKNSLEAIRKEGLRPVARTYTSVLAACSHAGELDEGYHSLKVMADEDDVNSAIEHFNCTVDLLGRVGCLSEAIKVLQSMPDFPGIIGWVSLLAACKTYGQEKLANTCFEQIVRLDPNAAASHTIMSGIHADSQKAQKAWIELNKKVFKFSVADASHSDVTTLYKRNRSQTVEIMPNEKRPIVNNQFPILTVAG